MDVLLTVFCWTSNPLIEAMNFLLFVTFASACIGGMVLVASLVVAETTPGQAAAATVAIGLAVIPYVMLRVVQLSLYADKAAARHADLQKSLELIESNTRNSKETSRQ